MPSPISRSYRARSGSWLSSALAPGGVSAGTAGRGPGIEPLARSGRAAGRVPAVVPGCHRAWGGGIGSPGLGGDAGELPQVLTGDQVPPADLDVGQVAAAHLVVEQVAGQAGPAGG